MRIGICGPMGSGKSTVAQILINRFTGERMSFAAALKERTSELVAHLLSCGWTPPAGYDRTAKDRKMLQFVGTDLVRTVDPEAWVSYLVRQIEAAPRGLNIFIDDVRYDNEVWALKAAGFMVVRLTCDEEVRQERLRRCYGEIVGGEHVSEHGITVKLLEVDCSGDAHDTVEAIIDHWQDFEDIAGR